tara:strand:+ start:264 stop:965 length:702 start_codon:yes stop_codon:yes gene_type:complete
MSSMNSYDLSRGFINFAFDNPEKISPNHYAIYFFAIEHCNRLGWKCKFGLPTMMVCDAVGIKKPQTFIKYFNDLEDWGFIKVVERSRNQYSANIISLISATPKKGEAMDKAMVKHAAKQGASKGQSNSPIDKQVNKEQITSNIDSERYQLFISKWNTIKGTKYKGSKNDINNFKFWLDTYSPTEIIKSIENHDDTFWAESINPQWLFRTKDTKGQPVDYIGQLLNHKPKNKMI